MLAFGFNSKLSGHVSFDIEPCLVRESCDSFPIPMPFNMPPVDGKRDLQSLTVHCGNEVIMRLVWRDGVGCLNSL